MFDDVKEVDDGCGNFYYVNTATGASGWTREEAADVPLPSGVVAGFDERPAMPTTATSEWSTGWSVDEVLEAAKQLSLQKRACPITVGGSPAPQPPTLRRGLLL